MIDEMSAHVAQCAASEIEPAAPVEGMIDGVIGNIFRNRPEIHVPVESCWRRATAAHGGGEHILHMTKRPKIAETAGNIGRRHAGWARQALRPVNHWSIGPDVDLVHRTYDARADPLIDQTGTFARMTLIPHLGHQLRLAKRFLAKNAGL